MEATARSARQVADELRAAVLAERRAQAAKLALVCELADTYRSVLPVLDLPGGPQLVSAGGDGTPEVDEFLVQEIHPLLGVGPAAAWSLLRQATNLRDRHPKVWALVQAGVVPAWQGRQVAELCQALPSDAAGYVDEQVALPLTHLPWPRVRRRLMGLIVTADTELAAEQAARARRGQFVRIKHNDDGTSWLLALLKTAEAVRLDETITTIARSICDDPDYVGGPDEARADAFGVLVTPSKAGQSAVVGSAPATLVVHLDHTAITQSPDSLGVVGRVEGPGGLDDIGPVLLNQVCELLAHRRVRVLPVIDLADQISADAYEIPDRLRTQVQLRDAYSVFPYDTTRARACDLDHTNPWRPGGPPDQTRTSNLAALGRRPHRAKTFGAWQLKQPRSGVFDWTSPLGYHYRVDHQGTTWLNDPNRLDIPNRLTGV